MKVNMKNKRISVTEVALALIRLNPEQPSVDLKLVRSHKSDLCGRILDLIKINTFGKRRNNLLIHVYTIIKKDLNGVLEEINRLNKSSNTSVPEYTVTTPLTEIQNSNEQFSQDESSQSELIVQEVLHNVEPIIKEEINLDREVVIPPVAPQKGAREGLSQTESNIAKHFKTGRDALTSIATTSKTRHKETLQDASALYGQLLAAKLRRLSKRTRLVLQNQIDNLVFQAELNEIDSATECDTSL